MQLIVVETGRVVEVISLVQTLVLGRVIKMLPVEGMGFRGVI